MEDTLLSESALSVESNDISIEFNITDKWTGGFNGSITVENISNDVIENWQIQFEFPHEIINIWNAQIISYEDGIYNIKNAGGNNAVNIPVGESVSFGFTGTYEDEIFEPENVKLISGSSTADTTNYSVDFNVLSDWGSGFSAEIIITNNTDTDMESWHLEMDFENEITNIWNAVIENTDNGRYYISNAGYNSVIYANSSVTFGFNGLNSVSNEPENYILNCSKTAEVDTSETVEGDNTTVVNYHIDTDEDGLPDVFEISIGTYIDNIDTDEDNISDYYEFIYGITSPLLPDSNNNDILDGDEDYDSDGLTFIEEINYGTNPTKEDSDDDTLNDYNEINQYFSNPAKYDTDIDGLNDYDEVILGFAPNLIDTDNNGICDADEKVLQTKSFTISCEESPELIGVDVEINMCGNIEDNLQVTNVLGIDTYNSNLVGLVGAPIDITCYTSFDNATITYKYDKNLIDDETASKLGVLSFDEESGIYENKNAVVDIENGTVTFSTNHFCSMPLCNIEEYTTAISNIPEYATENEIGNASWNGEVITVEKASSLLGISQSDITAMADNKNLYILKATGVYNLTDGTTLEIPHVYFSTNLMGNMQLYRISTDSTRSVLAPMGCQTLYTWSIISTYDFGLKPDGTKAYIPYTKDINITNPGYLKNEICYYIPASSLDTTDTDKDGLYDVYEYLGMRMTNGDLFYTDPKEADYDDDKVTDGNEIKYLPSGQGLFAMFSNPLIPDSDFDGIDDKNDKNPLKINKQPDVLLNTAIVFPNTEEFNFGTTYYFSAYAHNNSYDKLLNYSFDLKFYYGDDENPDVSQFTITDPTELGIMVVDQTGTKAKHLLPNNYAEKTWKILADTTVDIEKLKCLVVFKSETEGYEEIYSTMTADDFESADPEYENTTINAYVNDSYLAPEMRGERAFYIGANVYNYKNYGMKNVKATLSFENPEYVELLEDNYSTDLVKSVDKILGKQNYSFGWEIRVKDDVDLADVKYTVVIEAEDYDENVSINNLDSSAINNIDINYKLDQNYYYFKRSLTINIQYANAKTVDIIVKDLVSDEILFNQYITDKNSSIFNIDLIVKTDNMYLVEVEINKGINDERKESKVIDVNSIGEYKILYQTNRRPGLAKDEEGMAIEGVIADDLLYNDYTTEQLMAIENGTIFNEADVNKSDEELFETFKHWMLAMTIDNWTNEIINSLIYLQPSLVAYINDDISTNGEKFILPLVNHFKNGNGENFTNQYLTKAVKEHHSTQEYIDFMVEQIKKKLNETQGDITIINPDYWKNEENKMELAPSLNFADFSDNFEGLALSIHDVWATDISIKDYIFDGINYTGTIKLTLYDHFGLNELDIDDSKNIAGVLKANWFPLFTSWYLLQHNQKYEGNYKPFITVAEIEYPFEGSVE